MASILAHKVRTRDGLCPEWLYSLLPYMSLHPQSKFEARSLKYGDVRRVQVFELKYFLLIVSALAAGVSQCQEEFAMMKRSGLYSWTLIVSDQESRDQEFSGESHDSWSKFCNYAVREFV